MNRMRWIVLGVGLVIQPAPVSAQLILRDEIAEEGPYFETLSPNASAFAGLSVLGDGGERYDGTSALLGDLRRMGVRGVYSAGRADVSVDYVAATCEGREMRNSTGQIQWAMYLEVLWWLAEDLEEIVLFKALDQGYMGTAAYNTDVYVERCANVLSDALIRLGFDEG